MLRTVNWLGTFNWLTRALGFAWLGLLAFLLAPPPGEAATLVRSWVTACSAWHWWLGR